jgi:hypothetical protein
VHVAQSAVLPQSWNSPVGQELPETQLDDVIPSSVKKPHVACSAGAGPAAQQTDPALQCDEFEHCSVTSGDGQVLPAVAQIEV